MHARRERKSKGKGRQFHHRSGALDAIKPESGITDFLCLVSKIGLNTVFIFALEVKGHSDVSYRSLKLISPELRTYVHTDTDS